VRQSIGEKDLEQTFRLPDRSDGEHALGQIEPEPVPCPAGDENNRDPPARKLPASVLAAWQSDTPLPRAANGHGQGARELMADEIRLLVAL